MRPLSTFLFPALKTRIATVASTAHLWQPDIPISAQVLSYAHLRDSHKHQILTHIQAYMQAGTFRRRTRKEMKAALVRTFALVEKDSAGREDVLLASVALFVDDEPYVRVEMLLGYRKGAGRLLMESIKQIPGRTIIALTVEPRVRDHFIGAYGFVLQGPVTSVADDSSMPRFVREYHQPLRNPFVLTFQ
ncbi:MAG: hypothetical protein JWM56_1148 [Candidatus Peribacteria bacterium]|nr:hypothetical protein [Candidatus Peribacteria bacterium]